MPSLLLFTTSISQFSAILPSTSSGSRDSGGRRAVRSDPPTYTSVLETNSAEDSEADDSEADEEKPLVHAPARFVPTQKSDDGGYPIHHHEHFNRTVSAVSLPVGKQLKDMSDKTPYERALDQLNNDAAVHKEIALGRRIGFYRLGKELGAGNFSKVKLGVHQLTKEKVAVKIMDKAKMDQKAQKLLTREIQSMEKMNHPHIVKLFECVETLTRVHLVVEYASGGELYATVHGIGKLPESQAKSIFAQIVSAVAHMHSRNLVHRDIKAENVMFSSPDHVKLVDFGFSCLIEKDQLLETFCGSPPYAAPELFRDKSYSGELVDIWALGVLLYFMLVGVTPFRGENVSDMKQMIMDAKYSFPDFFDNHENPEIRQKMLQCKALITRMLQPDTTKRVDINFVRRSPWINELDKKKSYLSIKDVKIEDAEKEKTEVTDKVWKTMHNYGITKEMLVEDNTLDKGPRDAVIGTYRIVLFQVQQELAKIAKEKEGPSTPDQANGTQNGQKNSKTLKNRSKTCIIL